MAGLAVGRGRHRFAALDPWRGAAALAVVYGHFSAGRLGKGELFLAFYLAVDFFFVLSGFVLVYRYLVPLTTERSAFTPVVVARFARLYPAHACMLLALPLVAAILLHHAVEIPARRALVRGPVLA